MDGYCKSIQCFQLLGCTLQFLTLIDKLEISFYFAICEIVLYNNHNNYYANYASIIIRLSPKIQGRIPVYYCCG